MNAELVEDMFDVIVYSRAAYSEELDRGGFQALMRPAASTANAMSDVPFLVE